MKLELKTVTDFPNYSADTKGNIYSKRRYGAKGGEMKQFIVKGYKRVTLWHNGKYKSKNVHRIIAECFLENPYNKPQINHINGIKTDNHIDNLEWVTPKENSMHSYRTGLSKSKAKGKTGYNSYTGIEVFQYSKTGQFINKYGSMHEANRATGVSVTCISLNINEKLKTAGGFIWKRN